MHNNPSLSIAGTFEENVSFFIFKNKKSRKPIEELFFFEIDGMDQAKTLLPHYGYAPKNIEQIFYLSFILPLSSKYKYLYISYIETRFLLL